MDKESVKLWSDSLSAHCPKRPLAALKQFGMVWKCECVCMCVCVCVCVCVCTCAHVHVCQSVWYH